MNKRRVIFGGGNSLDNFIARNDHAVDWLLWNEEVASSVNIHPVLLGSGIPLFHQMKRQIDLELVECRTFRNGCVLVTYRVKFSGA